MHHSTFKFQRLSSLSHLLYGRSPKIVPQQIEERGGGPQVLVVSNSRHVVEHEIAVQSILVADASGDAHEDVAEEGSAPGRLKKSI